jgi:DNA-binding PadR family transcriptional regulator
LRKLEEASYVTIEKSFVDRKPKTEIAITSLGRKAFVKYLNSLSPLLNRR